MNYPGSFYNSSEGSADDRVDNDETSFRGPYTQWMPASAHASQPLWNQVYAPPVSTPNTSGNYHAGPSDHRCPRTDSVHQDQYSSPRYVAGPSADTAYPNQSLHSHYTLAANRGDSVPNTQNAPWSTTSLRSPWHEHPTSSSASHPTPLPSASRHHPVSNAQIHIPEYSPEDDPLQLRAGAMGQKTCSHCHTAETPLWRRDPRTHKPLCNACGIYLYQRHAARPEALIAVDREVEDDTQAKAGREGPCANCGTRKTSSWRRDRAGAQVCNACGVYERMNGRPRPLALRKDKIRPRTKPQ